MHKQKFATARTRSPARETRTLPGSVRILMENARSQHACLLETEIAGASFGRRADDDVIEQFDLQKLGGFGQASRQTVVSLARRGISGRMIVYNDDCVG